MPTTREVAAKRSERMRRKAQRFYTPEKLGPRCRFCGLQVPLILEEATHPCCGPEAVWLLERSRRS